MTNPLLAKYEELYGKKEEPKEEKYKMPPEWDVRGLTTPSVATSNTGTTKANPIPKLTSYDPHSTEDSFLQVAELIKQKKGKIISMSMSVDATKLFAKTIFFEVMVADWDTP